MLNLFIYCVSFLVILYLFKRSNGQDAWSFKLPFLFFLLLYVSFCWVSFYAVDWFVWLGLIPLLYALLDDCLTGELDIRFPIGSSLFFCFIYFEGFILLFALILFGLLWLLARKGWLSDGEPYLIFPFFFLIPSEYWFNFFFVSSLAGSVFLLVGHLIGRTRSVPFSYFLFTVFIFHLGFYHLVYPNPFF